jgi:hypothetical protein
MVNESATSFLQTFINHVRQIVRVELVRAEWTLRAQMKWTWHET